MAEVLISSAALHVLLASGRAMREYYVPVGAGESDDVRALEKAIALAEQALADQPPEQEG
jgi:hypothetical protein